MNKIFTKTGDEGMTSIRGGVRLPKDDIRIEANGTIDEFNALLGVVRTLLQPNQKDWQELLHSLQRELMVVMSHVATPEGKTNPRELHVVEWTQRMEQLISQMHDEMELQKHFILPGGTPLSAHLQWARTVCRRAERRLWTLHRESHLNADILIFMNRFSDLLFMMARYQMNRDNCIEEEWY